MIVDSLDGQGCPAHVPCQSFDGFPVGAIDGLSRMNVESGVVIPRHQPFNHVTVQDFLLLQRVQKPGAETYGNSGCGTAFQLMKTTLPNKPGKHKRMNMGMEVEQAAVGLQTEDPSAQAIVDLQEFMKVFLPGLPCAPKRQFAESAYATQVTMHQLGDGEGDVPMIQGMNNLQDLFPEQ